MNSYLAFSVCHPWLVRFILLAMAHFDSLANPNSYLTMTYLIPVIMNSYLVLSPLAGRYELILDNVIPAMNSYLVMLSFAGMNSYI